MNELKRIKELEAEAIRVMGQLISRTYRTEVMEAYLFESIEQVRETTDHRLPQYYEQRPNDSLEGLPPLTYLPREATAEEYVSPLST